MNTDTQISEISLTKAKLVSNFNDMFTLQFCRVNGVLDYDDCLTLLHISDYRLPSLAEVKARVTDRVALFELWIPISDSKNDWVCVGYANGENSSFFLKSYKASHNGSEPDKMFGHRLVVGYMSPRDELGAASITSLPLTSLDHLNTYKCITMPMDCPRDVSLIRVTGSLSYQACWDLAFSYSAFLPTKAEVISYVKSNVTSGTLAEFDLWIPIADTPNDWISVGNFDAPNRFLRTHKELFGVTPSWSTTQDFYAFRTLIILKTLGRMHNPMPPSGAHSQRLLSKSTSAPQDLVKRNLL
jgi:hypothetical protein